MQERGQGRRQALVVASVVGLLVVFVAQLAVTVARDSSTWDEGDHIYAGYESWTRRDFGLNPEHPPLIKLIATMPLLTMRLNVPEPPEKMFMAAAFLGGKSLLFESGNDAEAIFARTRAAAGVLAVQRRWGAGPDPGPAVPYGPPGRPSARQPGAPR